ncbi:hypothetical protein [Nocardia sp. alder85J]|uniref:hypothetical protein n=1 Tax=Nocardia sp. alder85J TaxID=2862949 RepID=UPI001CD1C52E|nr:hypothetical protein [Nocardia sp. alder85J]MCX4096076.1 hypothetical protein [Nocardia sp. alder85J]
MTDPMHDPIPDPTSARPVRTGPVRVRLCLTDSAHGVAMVSLFLVPEPRVRGASMLHLLEQAPIADGVPVPDAELTAALEQRSLPGVRVRLLPVATRRPGAGDPFRSPSVRTIFHDHYIADGPLGLDPADAAELTRLALLPERPIGPRRIDDFQDYSIRQAMSAIYRYFGVDQRIPLMYHGYADPADAWLAIRTALA